VFDHVTIRAGDLAASAEFYDTVLAALEIAKTSSDEHPPEWDDFSIAPATGGKPVTRRLHIGFAAPSRSHVDRFWRVGTAAGFADDGAPGPRPQYRHDYYGAFLRDPDGNSAEAVHHGAMRGGGIDHLWIRVADVAASKRFYETIAPHAGLRLGDDAPDRAQFLGEAGSFSLVAGEPTEHVHMAFPAGDDATVEAFHRAATEAGYRDNGPPGERPVYHPGYYGAFVLDPDGNNVELVNHNRRRATSGV
jgi:catechol 2,3-dioxygenase-like lactoylglutathione lyase family enzyme